MRRNAARIISPSRKADILNILTIPTAEQLAARRAGLWHQDGTALLTVEALRDWVNQAGLVLYTRRSQQLPAPAPTLVEAVLGATNAEPTAAEMEQARSLMARLIAEGSAVPLNLLGSTTDVPDYVCSVAVFSYVFTLRGDKAWKQPPATIGAVKVSPLGLATYEAIARRVMLSAAELATELGKEVTEGAVLRGLVELWAQLRVMPVPQQDGTVLWELMSTRLTKQIKAGANAGQPSALSAVISLYLGMTVAATEEEIETILSPLAPRSRIRDVVHALMGARQAETMAIDGRTVVYLAGDLPEFAAGDVGAPAEGEVAIEAEGRISKFVPRPKKVGTGFAKKFSARPAASPGADRERRPFQKKAFGDAGKPSFSKPWEEGRAGAEAPVADGSEQPRAGGFDRAKRPGFGAKPGFGGKPGFGAKARFGSGAARGQGGTRPTFRRDDGRGPAAEERPRREYAPRPVDQGENGAGRKVFGDKLAFGKKPGFGGKPSFGGKPAFGKRPGFAGKPGAGREGGSERPAFGGSGEARAPRREYSARPGSARPASGSFEGGGGSGERRPGSYAARPQGGGFAGRKAPFAGKPAFGASGRGDFAASAEGAPKKVYRKFDAPRGDKPRYDKAGPGKGSFDRPKAPFNPEGGPRASSGERAQGFAGKPGGFAGKKPFGRPGSKPPGTFAKFADGAQPFRRPFAGKPGGVKTGPTFRKRKPEGTA